MKYSPKMNLKETRLSLKTQADLGWQRQQQLGSITTFSPVKAPLGGVQLQLPPAVPRGAGSVCRGSLGGHEFPVPHLSPQRAPPFPSALHQLLLSPW